MQEPTLSTIAFGLAGVVLLAVLRQVAKNTMVLAEILHALRGMPDTPGATGLLRQVEQHASRITAVEKRVDYIEEPLR